jgi:hypothetical protein
MGADKSLRKLSSIKNGDFEGAEETHLANVDLDIYSRSDLQPLVTAFGKKVFVLYVGRYRRTYKAVLELTGTAKSADLKILSFCRLIRALPKPERRIWNAAVARDFNVGVQVRAKPNSYRIGLSALAVKAASEVGARIVFTIYSPEFPEINVSQPG